MSHNNNEILGPTKWNQVVSAVVLSKKYDPFCNQHFCKPGINDIWNLPWKCLFEKISEVSKMRWSGPVTSGPCHFKWVIVRFSLLCYSLEPQIQPNPIQSTYSNNKVLHPSKRVSFIVPQLPCLVQILIWGTLRPACRHVCISCIDGTYIHFNQIKKVYLIIDIKLYTWLTDVRFFTSLSLHLI